MIVGIDPGSSTVGYAFLSGTKQKPVIHDYGVILTDKDSSWGEKFVCIAHDLGELLALHKPKQAYVEELFFATNAKTVMGVAQARGVILLSLEQAGVPTQTLTPLQVKQSLTGYGKATKKQIQQMVTKFLHLDEVPKPDDAADALALAFIGL